MAEVQFTVELQKELDVVREQFLAQAPRDVIETLRRSADELLHSRILERSLKAGDRPPDFTLPNAVGKEVRLGAVTARGSAIVSFYRGGWCPYCSLQLRAYQQVLPQFRELGAELLAISPETPDKSQATLLKNFLQYEVLSDVGNGVARRFGLVYALGEELQQAYRRLGVVLPEYNGDDSWEIPLPGTFVIDRTMTVRLAFVDLDYTKRLEPEAILQTLAAIRAEERASR